MTHTVPNVPRTLVLSYLGTPTLTRVRKFATLGAFVIAAGYTLASAASALVTAEDALTAWRYPSIPVATPPAASFWVYHYLHYALTSPAVYVSVTLVAAAVLAWVVAWGVRGAKRWTCATAVALAVPVMLTFCWVAAAMIGVPLFALGTARSVERTGLMWAIGLAVMFLGALPTLLALLTIDLMACLNWMRRNPVEEMPARKFL